MKNYIEIYINGKPYQVSGSDIFLPLSEYLRSRIHLKGTKEVCIEGDCGACTTLIGRFKNGKIQYETVDSCICYIYQLNKCHIVTVEGVKNSKLHPIQETMIKNHGAQCGYCTPGFIVSLCSFFDDYASSSNSKVITKKDIQDTLTGNLCRCTGYETIIEAALSVDKKAVEKLDDIYPKEKLSSICKENSESIAIETKNRYFYEPVSLQEALELKDKYNDAILIAGGTDLHVMCNKKDFKPQKIIHLSNLKELKSIEANNQHLIVGAGVALSEFELIASKYYPGLKEFMELFASPQIKNIATLAGNIANASPIGDTLPFLFIMEAMLTLESTKKKREININNFYKGYKILDKEASEILTKTSIPLLSKNETLRLYKVSKRRHLDISSFSAAIKLEKENERVKSISIAFGGVGPTVIRAKEIEEYLIEKEFTQNTFENASNLLDKIITPISDVRGSREYRLQLAKNSLMKLYFDLKEKEKVLI